MKAALLVFTLALPLLAQAQVYKWVGPDGKVTYSDAPPPSGAKAVERRLLENEQTDSRLPFALQQAVNANPVTLFTTKECQACDDARQLLAQRGVPLRERTVNSREDLDELKGLAGSDQLPVLRVGTQFKRGFEAETWQQALTSAGYPEQSRLPANWRNPAVTPLAARKPPPVAANAPDPRAAAGPAPAASPPPPPNAPPGFRF
jgi:glutaredoxin